MRQGDPLSSYHFLLCTKGLVNLLKNSAQDRSLKGIRVYKGAPFVNHLLFAYDSLIFCKTDSASSQHLLDVLNQYAKSSGKSVNIKKTTMIFSQNIGREVKNDIMAQWGCRATQHYEKYLGLPPIVGRSRMRAF